VLQEVDIRAHRVIQQQEIRWSLFDDSALNEITAELAIMDSTKTDQFKFAIGVWDAHAGLSGEDALVARKDATFPLPKRECALTTDNATEWYGASPPTTPRAAAPAHTAASHGLGAWRKWRVLAQSTAPEAVAFRGGASGSESSASSETTELHGEHHPPVAIKFGAEPLVSRGQGRMELRFHVVGALIGFKYRIVLQEVDIRAHRVIQQQEIRWSLFDDSALNEITAELVKFDITKTRESVVYWYSI
jgi:hypothetical protein